MQLGGQKQGLKAKRQLQKKKSCSESCESIASGVQQLPRSAIIFEANSTGQKHLKADGSRNQA